MRNPNKWVQTEIGGVSGTVAGGIYAHKKLALTCIDKLMLQDGKPLAFFWGRSRPSDFSGRGRFLAVFYWLFKMVF